MRRLMVAGVVMLMGVGCQQNNRKPQEQVWDLRQQQGTGVEVQAEEARGNAPVAREKSGSTIQPQQRGKMAKVRFRRDALGLASGTTALPLMSDGSPNWPVSISGAVVAMDAYWVVLEVNQKRYSIPTSAILMVEWE